MVLVASISTGPGGLRIIQFMARDGKRKSIRLGKVSKRIAEEVRVKVEALHAAAVAGLSWDAETARWVNGLAPALYDKLAAVGLCPPRAKADARLKAFVDSYITGRTDIKPRTRLNLEACAARLVEFFGAERPLGEIQAGDADDFCSWLRSRYAQATAARTIKRAKQFFRSAVRKKLIGENPFADCKAGHQSNRARSFFVTREAAQLVLDNCPDLEWRLLFALARFGGLRCPSETLALEWADVDWERSRMRVRSSKQEHEEDGGERWVPLFPELRPYLEEAFEQAPEGTVYVITRYRDTSANLRTGLNRIIRRAGLTPWQRPWHNLRATRQTELSAEFPLHVVCAWIGNKQAVAAEHYLQVTEADFEGAAKSGAVALQNPVQQAAAPSRTDSLETTQARVDCGLVRDVAICCKSLPDNEIPPRGGEPPADLPCAKPLSTKQFRRRGFCKTRSVGQKIGYQIGYA
jgi:integrase